MMGGEKHRLRIMVALLMGNLEAVLYKIRQLEWSYPRIELQVTSNSKYSTFVIYKVFPRTLSNNVPRTLLIAEIPMSQI